MQNKIKDTLMFLFPFVLISTMLMVEYQFVYRNKLGQVQRVHDFFTKLAGETVSSIIEIDKSIINIIQRFDNCNIEDIHRMHALQYSRAAVTELLVIEKNKVICGNKNFYIGNLKLKPEAGKLGYTETGDSLIFYRYDTDKELYILWATSFKLIKVLTRTPYNSLIKIEYIRGNKIYASSIGSRVNKTDLALNKYNITDYAVGVENAHKIRIYFPNIDIIKISNQGIIYIITALLCSTLFSLSYFMRTRASLYFRIRAALKKDEFIPYYQPIVDLETGDWIGAEALIRWYKDDTVYKYPDEFIPYAEHNHLSIGFQKVCFQGCMHLVECIPNIDEQFFISINISPSDLNSYETEKLFDLKKEYELSSHVELEITERGIDPKKMNEFSYLIKKLHKHGIRISLDDFGTGQAGLSYINSLSFDKIKIDKKFVDAIGTDSVDFNILTTIIELAKKLDVLIVAEGIETERQRKWLLEQGVTVGQGWLFSKALSHADFLEGLVLSKR